MHKRVNEAEKHAAYKLLARFELFFVNTRL